VSPNPKQLLPPRHIRTRALDADAVGDLAERLRRLEQVKSARPQGSPLDSAEQLPLDVMESIIGLRAQGDAHRNDLELLYDRIMGHAAPPVHTGPARPAPPPRAPQALPPALPPKTLLAPPTPPPRAPHDEPLRDPYQRRSPRPRRARQTLDTLDESGLGQWDKTLDRSLDGDESASGRG